MISSYLEDAFSHKKHYISKGICVLRLVSIILAEISAHHLQLKYPHILIYFILRVFLPNVANEETGIIAQVGNVNQLPKTNGFTSLSPHIEGGAEHTRGRKKSLYLMGLEPATF